ncbi:MAG TPA: FAD-binding oxidoreductase, partial [Anaeromyxobacteraceae bacterium]|nr:FAD-binding oxidoreductase [Anaeromyxobacteraceae bacterium]
AAASAVERARGALAGLGGSLVLTAAPRQVRAAVDPWGPPPPAFPVMQALKDRLDPERRLNPGRFVGGI